MRVPKTVKRVARKVRGKVIKRYFNKGYAPKVSTIVRDVAALKRMVNAEKKRLAVISSTTPNIQYNNMIGQMFDNGYGYLAFDITPKPAQGTNSSTRNGASIKWHSFHMDMMIYHQTAAEAPIKLEFYVVKIIGTPIPSGSITAFPQTMFINNAFVSGGNIIDTYSRTNPDAFGRYRVIKKKVVYIKEDSTTNATMIKDVKLGFKLKNQHVRFNNDSQDVNDGQYLLIGIASGGNCGPTASTITPVPIQTARSGLHVYWNYTNYYYDN